MATTYSAIAVGSGMRVIAWNRTPKTAPGVTFVDLDTLLTASQVLSVHLLLTDETRAFLGAERLAKLRRARDGGLVRRRLDALAEAARTHANVIPAMLDAARAYATLFEIREALENVYGSYREPIFF